MTLDFNIEDAARALDKQQLLDWQRGWQVINPGGGSNLVTAGTGNFEYDAASGDINAGGSTVSCSQETVDFSTDIDANDDKFAVIYRDSAGTLQKSVGSAGTRDPSGEDPRSTFAPPPPTLSGTDAVILAEVLLPAGASSIGSSELRDRRLAASLSLDTLTLLSSATIPTLNGVDSIDGGVTTTAIQDFEGTNLSVDGSNVLNASAPDNMRVETVSSNTTTSGSAIYLVDTSGGAVTLTLASADATNEEAIGVVNITGSNDVTVDTESSETIDPGGASSKTISPAGWVVWFSADGTNWDSSLDAEYEQLDVTNATLVDVETDAAVTGNNAGNWASPSFGTENKDERNEFSSDQFTPDQTGWYHVSATARCSSPSDGDPLSIRLRNTTDSTTVRRAGPTGAANGTDQETFGYIVGVFELTASKAYEIQCQNADSTFDVDASFGWWSIRRAMR